MSHLTRSGAILAGGQSTRFGGRDKSALLLDGRPILDHQIAALTPAVDEVLIVGGPRATIHDIVPGCGPLGGLHAALTAAHGGAVLIVACDMPYLSTPFLTYLLSFATEADIVVPRTERAPASNRWPRGSGIGDSKCASSLTACGRASCRPTRSGSSAIPIGCSQT